MEGISDIDLVIVVDRLDRRRFDELCAAFALALEPVVGEAGYRLLVNPTLGPLKFNDPRTAVLHLMLYSAEGHVEHVLESPFTCSDWQLSGEWRVRPLAEVYPTFALQPRHFVSARRSIGDYLADLRADAVSYRELACDDDGYVEVKKRRPMTPRDRFEFAYHVMKFLMLNLVKLVHRERPALEADALPRAYFAIFPEQEARIRALYKEVRRRKLQGDFEGDAAGVARELEAFADAYERQFRRTFFEEASRHVVFRHAPTAMNRARGEQKVFLGRTDVDIEGDEAVQDWEDLAAAARDVRPSLVYSSPLRRCRQSLERLGRSAEIPLWNVDDRLAEIEYGLCEGLSVATARTRFPELFEAWRTGRDPSFPGGETTGQVRDRVAHFLEERWPTGGPNTLVCTHNVVLRCLVGETLLVPPVQWHRLRIPHLAPFLFVRTRRLGVFLDLPIELERRVFADFAIHVERRAAA